MKRSSTSQALAKARRAFDKASQALPEYATLQKAREAHNRREASRERVRRLLNNILGTKTPISAEDLALFQQATTVLGYEELGHDKIQELIAAMQVIENRRIEEENRRAHEMADRLRTRQDFTDEERRLILSTLHPDANASPERREAAFKAFNAKRGSKIQR
jgi:hypothetical protein